MRETWVSNRRVKLPNEKRKEVSKQIREIDRGLVENRRQMFACKSKETIGVVNDCPTKKSSNCSKSTCYGKMDTSLQLLKSEMIELAYLNVQLMEKMIEMQNQIECIKQERADMMLELYKSEKFEKKVELLIANASCFEKKQRKGSFFDDSDSECSRDKNAIRPGRKSTLDSLSSLPSVSSIQSEGSFSAFETENEDEFCIQNETASSDSGIDVRYEAADELDCFLAAATTTDV